MKRYLQTTTAALTSLLAIGLYSAPALSAMVDATTAEFEYGLQEGGIVDSNRVDPNNAIGNNLNTFRSLGAGGAGVFSFGTAFSGPVTIWEITNGTVANWQEAVDVYAGNTWNRDFNSLFATDWELNWTK